MFTEKHKRAAGYKIVISKAKTYSIEELTTIPFSFFFAKQNPNEKGK